jgi:Protein of unknown function, DUF488
MMETFSRRTVVAARHQENRGPDAGVAERCRASSSLRRWFGHDPKKWSDFRKQYFRELRANPDAVAPIVTAANRGTVTLLYSSHDSEHNNAVALRDYIEDQLKKKRRAAESIRTSARSIGDLRGIAPTGIEPVFWP